MASAVLDCWAIPHLALLGCCASVLGLSVTRGLSALPTLLLCTPTVSQINARLVFQGVKLFLSLTKNISNNINIYVTEPTKL
jgi:hypothetical protein